MKPRLSLLAVLLGALVAARCEVSVENEPEIAGVWQVIERSFTTPDSSWTNSTPQPGYYFYGDRYFSVQEIRESGPRPLFTESVTDSARLAAFDVFHAHAGTYEVHDSTLTIVPTLAKSPDSMDGRPYDYVYQVSHDTLTIRRTSESGSTRVTKLKRLE